MKTPFFCIYAFFALSICTQAQPQGGSPFAPPRATMHYSPDRTCDLQNLEVDVDVNYPDRSFSGTSVNTLSPLRSGISEVNLQAGTGLEISAVTLDGKPSKYAR